MKMRTGCPPGRADGPDPVTAGDHVADLHVDPGEVEVARKEPAAVVEDDRPSRKVEVLGKSHASRRRRVDVLPGVRREIDPRVRRARLAVEDAPGAEALLAHR